jgi:peptidoglycan/LPS O-acetylase OafA/YrhL
MTQAYPRLTGPAVAQASVKLTGLQSGRAVAAIMVVVFHANAYLLPATLYDGVSAGQVFNFGYAGVEFFFVLSGFIMLLVHRQDFGKPAKALIFIRKRILRIYPIYWVVMCALIVLYLLVPDTSPDHMRDPVALLASLALWPMPDGPMMQVAWTLQHEMAFYLVFALILLNQTVGGAIFLVWMAACVLALPAHGTTGYPLDFLLKPHNILFLLGLVAALAHRHFSPAAARAAFWGGTAAFLGLGLSETVFDLALMQALLTLGYGIAAATIIIGLAQGNLPAPAWLSFLGDASYAVYLVHLPAMKILAVGLQYIGAPEFLSPLIMLIVITLAVTGIGAAVHVFIEKPLIRALAGRRRTGHAA